MAGTGTYLAAIRGEGEGCDVRRRSAASTCEAHIMGRVAGHPEGEVPPCDEPGAGYWEQDGQAWALCAGCAHALRAILAVGSACLRARAVGPQP